MTFFIYHFIFLFSAPLALGNELKLTQRNLVPSNQGRLLQLTLETHFQSTQTTPFQTTQGTHLIIQQGETKKIKISPRAKIIASHGKVFKVSALGSTLWVRGRSVGTGRISAGNDLFEVSVLSKDEYSEYWKLKNLLMNFQGLSLEVRRPEIIVTGELLRSSDWEEIIKLNIKNLKLVFTARVHPQARSDVKALLTSYIENHHIPVGYVNLENTPQMTLSSGQAKILKTYEKILRPIGLEINTNPESISMAPMVRTNIVVASLRRDQGGKFGFKWPGSYQAQVVPNFDISKNSQENSLTLQMLESKGWGRVLASPTLLCRSGKEASFFAGGEIPIRILSYRYRSVVWKNYGVLLKIKPLADYQGQMSIDIETEVSSLDESLKADDIPALITNRMNSHFDLTQSRTIALSGLITTDKGRSREGLPLLSRVPILGSFFSSEDFRENKSELVIFVTPQIVLPTDTEENASLPTDWNDETL